MKTSILYLLLILFSIPAMAQDATSLIAKGKSDLEAAVNQSNVDAIKQAQALFQRASQDKSAALYAYYYLGFAEYRLASINESEMIDHLNNSIDYLEKMLKLDKENVEGKALLGSVVGWKAGLKPMQAMFLGPRSTRLLSSAQEAAPENPRVTLFKAVSDFNTPEQWGGDKDKALEGFKKAAGFFENERTENELQPSWGHPDVYAWIGIAHMERGQNAEAKVALEKALEINPEFGWVKYQLMPQLAANE